MTITTRAPAARSGRSKAFEAAATAGLRFDPREQRESEERPEGPDHSIDRQQADPANLRDTWEFMKHALDLGQLWQGNPAGGM